MVIDSSSLLAILLNEEDAERHESAIEADAVRLVSAGSLLEAAVVVESRYGSPGGRELDLLFQKASIEVVAFDSGQAELARDAYRRFGKGRHAAGLNIMDCFAYALSMSSGEPLLFKGDDFTKTDVRSVL
jgi:ribonuclease VapC